MPARWTIPRSRQSSINWVCPKYIQWTRRWKEVGSGTGRKILEWEGEEGRTRGKRLAGTLKGRLDLADCFSVGSIHAGEALIKSRGLAPANSPLKKVDCEHR